MPKRLPYGRRTGLRFGTRLDRFGFKCQPSGFDGECEGARHVDGVAAAGNGGVQQYAVKTPFHHLRRLRGQTQARVDDQRRFGQAFAQDVQRIGVNRAQTRADRGCPGHQRLTARVEQAAAGNQVFGAIRQHFEAVFNQDFRRFDELEDVGLQRCRRRR